MAALDRLDELTYVYPRIKDHTLDDIGTLCALDNGHHYPTPTYTLAVLDQLPLEIVYMILIRSGIRSLTDFRRVNHRAMQTVDSIPQYKAIVTHVSVSLRGILTIGSGCLITCQDLYDKLCTAKCDVCGDFGRGGGGVSIPDYLLPCLFSVCFTEKIEYLPLLWGDAVRKVGLGRQHLACLPSMKSIPGVYSPREIKCRARLVLIDFCAATQAGITLHGTKRAMERYVLEMASKKLKGFRSGKLQHRAGDDPTPRPPRSEDRFDGHTSNPRRFMAVVRAPFLDSRTRLPVWGFHCLACKNHHYGRLLHWRRKFTRESFEDHVRECGEIFDGKHNHQILN